MNPLDDLRRRRRIEAVYHLGVKPIAELLVEIADPIDLDLALDRYGRLDRSIVRALGADTFPANPLREVAS